MNNLIAYTKKKPKLELKIEYDENVGYYLYVYEISTNKCIADHLQDTLDFAKDDALEIYGVPLDSWKAVE